MRRAKLLLSAAASVAVCLPTVVSAQSVATPTTPVATPTSPATPTPQNPNAAIGGRVLGTPRGGATAPQSGGSSKAPTSFSGGDLVISNAGVRRAHGKVPEFHIVKKGDTLWELCQYYYGDPWAWPQLWAYNKGISNPHWIYPGDRVRLLAGPPRRSGFAVVARGSRRYDKGPITLRQFGFADPKDLEASGMIVGSKMEHLMLSLYHEVYVKGSKKKDKKSGVRFKPRRGVTYTIYRIERPLKSAKKDLGHVVRILGSLRVKRVNKHKIATAEITEALNEIRRGDRVGPLRRTFKRLPVRPARKDLAGRVLDHLRLGIHIGQDDLVFLNRGKNQGVRRGNRFLVMRRGDGYRQMLQDKEVDHKEWPREAIAEIAVLDVREDASVGVITRSLKEVRKGDYIRMRRGY
ncbi:MAG: hypothetical protein CSA65_01525 [Proteobacteria bacterium]|nr:MAG: hypothetical protein CSB49_03195 [Pseudomonadota bacterium]PIE19691.1 MAG: hypothetical protein CSA65_01525 [Pseudomonadota bacterium]